MRHCEDPHSRQHDDAGAGLRQKSAPDPLAEIRRAAPGADEQQAALQGVFCVCRCLAQGGSDLSMEYRNPGPLDPFGKALLSTLQATRTMLL